MQLFCQTTVLLVISNVFGWVVVGDTKPVYRASMVIVIVLGFLALLGAGTFSRIF